MTAASDTPRGLLRSGGAATLAQLVRILALQATHIVVRRIVPVDEYGLWNWAEVVFLVLATVRDLGLPSHVVRLRPMPLGNLLAVQVGWGAALAALMLVGAPIVAAANSTPLPMVESVLRALALFLILEGLAVVPLVWFEATLRIERSFAPEMLRTAVYCVVVLALAARGAGVWSFVGAQLAGQAIYAAELWRRARRGGMPLHFERGATGRLVRESLPLGSIWLLALAVTYTDGFVVAALFSSATVAIYFFAYQYAYLVFRVLQQPIGRALYPAFVAFADRPAEQVRAYRLGTVLFLAIEVPAALFLALNAEAATRILGGDQYLESIPLLQLLAFAPLVDPLGRFGGEFLVARRFDRARVLSLVLNLAALAIGGWFLARAWGPVGMAWANFLPIGTPVVAWALWKSAGGGALRRLARELVEAYLVPLLPFALAAWAAGDDLVLRFALSLAAALASLGWTWRRHAPEFRAFLEGGEIRPS